jgi:hypothetical protein
MQKLKLEKLPKNLFFYKYEVLICSLGANLLDVYNKFFI